MQAPPKVIVQMDIKVATGLGLGFYRQDAHSKVLVFVDKEVALEFGLSFYELVVSGANNMSWSSVAAAVSAYLFLF